MFNSVSPDELRGICLGADAVWVVEGKVNPCDFFRALKGFLPDGSIMYLEGTATNDAIVNFLKGNQAIATCKVQGGTIWPRPSIFHVQFSQESIDTLATLTEGLQGSEVCDHFHCYLGERVILEWFDAWYGDPLGLSVDFQEPSIKQFSLACGTSYKPFKRP